MNARPQGGMGHERSSSFGSLLVAGMLSPREKRQLLKPATREPKDTNEHFQRDRRMDANAQQESIRLTSLWKNLFVGNKILA